MGAAFNVALFVTFGGLLRHLTGRGITATTLAGAATSLLVELTQLTGDWHLYPCAYRLFDVDDLITNTTGALLGALILAPLLRRLPGQRPAPAEAPRPITTGRRLLGTVCDLLAVTLTAATLATGYLHLTNAVNPDAAGATQLRVLAWGMPALGQLALVWRTGATLGEHAVRLRPVAPTGVIGAGLAGSLGCGDRRLQPAPGTW